MQPYGDRPPRAGGPTYEHTLIVLAMAAIAAQLHIAT
jgi:hypothetical protein